MLIKPMRKEILGKAALASILIAVTSTAMAEVITYQYSGTIGVIPGSFLFGEAIQAEFVIDTSIAPVVSGTDRFYPYSVLSATYSFIGLTFHSTPYGDFNTSSSSYIAGANRNSIQINPGPTQNRLFLRMAENDLQGGFLGNSMDLQITDKPAFGALNSLEIPTSLSGLDLSPGNDIVIVSMGYCQVGGVCSTISSRNGSLSAVVAAPVPEPESYAMMLAGLGLLGLAVRRRKQKIAAAA